jgi:hypothetical protein
MSVAAGPKTVIDGLTLSADTANKKSYSTLERSNHGYSIWYCMVSGYSATYSIIDPNVTIFQNASGVITTVVSPSASPQRGTIAVTAGNTYYGNGPIFLLAEDAQHVIVPLSMAATEFAYYTNRTNPGTIYVHAPYQAVTVYFYDNVAGGITGTATSSISVSQGAMGTITTSNLGYFYLKSTGPIIASSTQYLLGSDKTILSPPQKTVYTRYVQYNITTVGTTPTIVGSYVVSDPVYNCMITTIADGSGGDCLQGLGIDYLCDTYSWGNAVSDYVIVAPYADTTVTVSYWNGSAWVVLETHVLLGGTTINPAAVIRDGTNGVGVAGGNINGGAANFVSGATGPWKWVGNNPFYVGINDTADDEFSMLGWSSNYSSNFSNIASQEKNLANASMTLSLINGPVYSNTDKNASIWATPDAFWNGSSFILSYDYKGNGVGNATQTFDTTIETPIGTKTGVMKYTTGSAGITTYPDGYKYWAIRINGLTAGVTYTFSYYARASITSNFANNQIWRDTGTDYGPSGDWNPTFTTEWQRYSTTRTMVGTYLDYFPIHSLNLTGGHTIYYWGFQMEVGSSATPFVAETRNNIVFDGIDDYITNSSFTGHQTNAGTIMGWAYPTSTSGDLYLVASGGTATTGASRAIRIYSGSWSCVNYGGGTTEDWNSIVSATVNTWQHVAYVWRGTTIRFYLNGIEYTNTRTGMVTPLGSVLTIGATAWSPVYGYWPGRISTAQAYNRALSAAEVQQNFNAQRTRYGI